MRNTITKISCFCICIACSTFLHGQPVRTINISLAKNSHYYKKGLEATADSAFKIASAVFSSKEFQDSLTYLDEFMYLNHCAEDKCDNINYSGSAKISGKIVLDSLFRQSNVTMELNLKKRGGAMGSTCPNTFLTTAYYKNIIENIPLTELPFSYSLAVNLCHEYMHQVGYCHVYDSINEPEGGKYPDPEYIDKDVAYRVGWIAYYILIRWNSEKKQIL